MPLTPNQIAQQYIDRYFSGQFNRYDNLLEKIAEECRRILQELGGSEVSDVVPLLPAHTIDSTPFTPSTASVGDEVVMTGENFVGITAVLVNGVAAPFTVGSATEITFTVPVGATTGAVTVTRFGVDVVSADDLTIS